MLTLRPAAERGLADFGWLRSAHSFSFGNYFDPQHMGFSLLRVINDDRVAGGGGFPPHPHDNMEIVSYVLDGALAHKDSLGNGSTILRGDVQRMSAGQGIRHSEFNASETEPTHFLQIWLLPRARGLSAGYAQKNFSDADKKDQLRLIVSPEGRDGSLSAQTDAEIYASLLSKDARVTHRVAEGRVAWVQVARGALTVNGQAMREGDGLAAIDERELAFAGVSPDSEFLVFDLPA
jgi:hypothetical protein